MNPAQVPPVERKFAFYGLISRIANVRLTGNGHNCQSDGGPGVLCTMSDVATLEMVKSSVMDWLSTLTSYPRDRAEYVQTLRALKKYVANMGLEAMPQDMNAHRQGQPPHIIPISREAYLAAVHAIMNIVQMQIVEHSIPQDTF